MGMLAAPRPHGAQVPDRARDATCCVESGAHLQRCSSSAHWWPLAGRLAECSSNGSAMLWRWSCSAPWPAKMETDRSSRRVCCRQGCAMERQGVAPSSDKPCFQMRTSRRECTITPKAYPLDMSLGPGESWERPGQSFECWEDSNIARGRFHFPFSSIFPRPLFVSISAQKAKRDRPRRKSSRVSSGDSSDSHEGEIGLSKLRHALYQFLIQTEEHVALSFGTTHPRHTVHTTHPPSSSLQSTVHTPSDPRSPLFAGKCDGRIQRAWSHWPIIH